MKPRAAMNSPEGTCLQAKEIELSYDAEPVISNFTLDLSRGSLIGLIGPNGAGKTTLLMALSGQFHPRQGAIFFEQMDIYKHNQAFKHRVGFVHEAPFFYPYLTVQEFLYFIAHVKKIKAGELTAQVDRVLQQVCLEEERQKLTGELSLGMRKKLAIAAALLGQPALLFLDEALNGVDIESVYRVKQVLRGFVAGGGTIVLSTHVLEVIEKLCDRYLVLKAGRIIADVSAADWRAEEGRGSGGLEEYIISLLRRSGR